MTDIPRAEVEKLKEGWQQSLQRMEEAQSKDAMNPKTHETHRAFRDGLCDQLLLCMEDLTALLERHK